jgi:hypothetical protein
MRHYEHCSRNLDDGITKFKFAFLKTPRYSSHMALSEMGAPLKRVRPCHNIVFPRANVVANSN